MLIQSIIDSYRHYLYSNYPQTKEEFDEYFKTETDPVESILEEIWSESNSDELVTENLLEDYLESESFRTSLNGIQQKCLKQSYQDWKRSDIISEHLLRYQPGCNQKCAQALNLCEEIFFPGTTESTFSKIPKNVVLANGKIRVTISRSS